MTYKIEICTKGDGDKLYKVYRRWWCFGIFPDWEDIGTWTSMEEVKKWVDNDYSKRIIKTEVKYITK